MNRSFRSHFTSRVGGRLSRLLPSRSVGDSRAYSQIAADRSSPGRIDRKSQSSGSNFFWLTARSKDRQSLFPAVLGLNEYNADGYRPMNGQQFLCAHQPEPAHLLTAR